MPLWHQFHIFVTRSTTLKTGKFVKKVWSQLSVNMTNQEKNSFTFGLELDHCSKVQILWNGHKIWINLPLFLHYYLVVKTKWKIDFLNSWSLLRIIELYQSNISSLVIHYLDMFFFLFLLHIKLKKIICTVHTTFFGEGK